MPPATLLDTPPTEASAEETLKQNFLREDAKRKAELPPLASGFEKDLAKIVQSEEPFGMRSSVGQHGARDVKVDTKMAAEYKPMSMQTKKNFRKSWAKRKLKEIIAEKTHVKTYRQVDRKEGEHMNFGKVVEQYGIGFER